MNTSRSAYLLVWTLLGGLLLPPGGRVVADIVHLKGGGRVEGRVIDRGDRVLVRFPSGEIEIPRERIERIEQKVSV
ncbi:MAG: hypothetical protein QF645_11360, partial [Planctomycetota bacterium]|nr:hypothetical protein [Planctomycetota bacterium]